MLLLIAWRNISRNFKRSGIMILAIAFGIWAGVFSGSLSLGMIEQMVQDALVSRLSHLQIHRPGFLQQPEPGATIPDYTEAVAQIAQQPAVKALSARISLMGMAASPNTSSGVQIIGLDPAAEAQVSDISQRLVEGLYFDPAKRSQVIIGRKLAEQLKVKLGQKIVLTAPTPSRDISAGAFRVVGIYQTPASEFDKMTVFINREEAGRVFDIGDATHEIAIMLDQSENTNLTAAELRRLLPELEVSTWMELSPELAMTIAMTDLSAMIMTIIILFALLFGITNTMLMGVLERTRELGVLMALGMRRQRIFGMILAETILLSIVGGAAGILIGAATNYWLGKTGIDFSLFAEGLSAYGMDPVVYPAIYLRHYIITILLVILTAILSAVYPGLKAVRLKPVEAIRTF